MVEAPSSTRMRSREVPAKARDHPPRHAETNVSDWHLELKCRIPEEMMPMVKQRLAECMAECRPRFTTVIAWYADATEELKCLPEPLGRTSAYEPEHVGRVS